MKSRTLAMSVAALAGIATGAVLVRSVSFGESGNAGYSSSSVSSPAPQASGDYVFACVNKSGKIDYLEFRPPLPHQCWFSGETLWHFAAVPAVAPSPSPSASPSPSPSVSISTSTSAAAAAISSSASASPSSSASSSATATSTPGN
jgi:hypothetical protein